MKKRKLKSQLFASILSLALLLNLLPVNVFAEINPLKVEIVLAADPSSNNLSLDTFSADLKSDILARYGIPSNQVFITSILSEQFDATQIDWHEFDHTNNSALAESTPQKLIVYDSEPYTNLIRDRHIVFSDEGQTIDFYGYGQEPYRDFLFTPDSTANNKDFTFTMNEAAVSYHTLKHGGFLFNAKYTYDDDTGDRYVSGYYVGIAESSVYIYQIDNMSVEDLMAGTGDSEIYYVNQATWDSYLASYTMEQLHSWGYYLEGTGPSDVAFKQLQTFSKPASVGGYRYLKLVASPTHVSLYQFTDNTYSATTTDGKIIDNYQLPQNYGSFGFGPFASYASHGCSDLTQLTFSDLSLSTNSSTSFTDLIRSIDWEFEDSMKLVVNVDNDGVEEFGNIADLGTILYYMGLENVHYAGWGINNTISIGSDTSVIGQAEGFILRNMSKGTTINRSDAQTDSLAEGVVVLSDYIYDNLTQFSPIDPPNTRLTFGDGGAIQIDVTDEETSAGNPVGAYEWQYMDIATGIWMTSTSETATANFNFATGSYNMVTVKIQDVVSSLWSDYTIAYIANDTDAPPVARFMTTKLPGKIVSTTNLSYHPAGEPLTAYEWKVYDSTLTEVTSMASSDENPEFNFSEATSDDYTIRLRVQKGDIWSSAFSQSISLALVPQSITFDSNGGSSVASIIQDVGSAVTTPVAPTRTGYTFAGWYPALPETMPENGASAKAMWVLIKVESDSIEVGEVEGLDDAVDVSNELDEGNDVDVVLEVNLLNESEVTAGDQEKVNDLIASEPEPDLVKVIYLDVSLFKVIGSDKENIHQTSGLIRISILIPEEHRGGTNYRIARIHDGVVEYLTADYNPATHILTFETDRFSTYALLYDMVNIVDTGEKESSLSHYVGILLLMASGGIWLYMRRRKLSSETE